MFLLVAGLFLPFTDGEESPPEANTGSRRSKTTAPLDTYITSSATDPAPVPVAEEVVPAWNNPPESHEVIDDYGEPCPRSNGFAEHMRATWWGYPRYFYERPLGSFARAHLNTSIFAGAVDRMVLFQYDFANSPPVLSSQLNIRGERELRRIAEMVLDTGMPLVIESCDVNRELDEKRRENVLRKLAEWSLPVSEDMVMVGRPSALGVSALEANLIYQNQLLQTFNYGVLGGSAGATGGSPA
jgi:hypothetical protein